MKLPVKKFELGLDNLSYASELSIENEIQILEQIQKKKQLAKQKRQKADQLKKLLWEKEHMKMQTKLKQIESKKEQYLNQKLS